MANKPIPSPEALRQLLSYDPKTGKLFWKERGPEWFRDTEGRTAQHACKNWNARYAGEEAFTSVPIGATIAKPIFARQIGRKICAIAARPSATRRDLNMIRRKKLMLHTFKPQCANTENLLGRNE